MELLAPLLQRISDAIDRAAVVADQTTGAGSTVDNPTLPLSPWATWLLFALIRHEKRQRWVGGVVATRLQGDPSGRAVTDAFAHPPIEQERIEGGKLQ